MSSLFTQELQIEGLVCDGCRFWLIKVLFTILPLIYNIRLLSNCRDIMLYLLGNCIYWVTKFDIELILDFFSWFKLRFPLLVFTK